jgi:hypothetical protein
MAENIVNDDPRPTGLQKNYPITLNNVEYQYFKTWGITRNDYVTTHETEAGTQEDVVTRKGRQSISVSVTCLQPLLAGLLALADLDEFEAKIYNPATDDYDTIDVRIGAGTMSYSLKEKSADLDLVNGVWQVNFTLEEF